MFIVFGVVLVVLIFLEAIGFGLDVALSATPILFAIKKAAKQFDMEWRFWGVITYIIGIALTAVMLVDCFSEKIAYGLWPAVICGGYCLLMTLIEGAWIWRNL